MLFWHSFEDRQAASPFFSIPAEQCDTYATAVAELNRYMCNRGPTANREIFYAEFQCLKPRSGEDPAFFKWELKSLLAKADPSLAADTKKALIARQYRQYMKGLPRTLQFKLLEHNPTPTLDEML